MPGQMVHANGANGPVTKRQKVQVDGDGSSAAVVRQSKIFAPFRVCAHGTAKIRSGC
jgi:U3 small nucleolar RNA-associated protein 21